MALAFSSKNQIFRYIRLTELIPELMDMVDEKKIALNPAYELSFLKKDEQVDPVSYTHLDVYKRQTGMKAGRMQGSRLYRELFSGIMEQIF